MMRIRFLLVLVMIFSVVHSLHASSYTQAVEIFRDIRGSDNIRLKIIPSNREAAWAECHQVVLTSAIVFNSTKDELAFIISHEVAHNRLGHSCWRTAGKYNKNPKKAEAEADIQAVINHYNKYNTCKGGKAFFRKLLKKYGNQGGRNDPHPSNYYRLKQIMKACGD